MPQAGSPRALRDSGAGVSRCPDASFAWSDATAATDPLIGDWDQEVGACRKVHAFDGTGQYTMVSTAGKRVSARYTVDPPSTAAERWLLAYTITSDNDEPDCPGSRVDEPGRSQVAYVEFLDDAEVEIYLEECGGSPLFAWERH